VSEDSRAIVPVGGEPLSPEPSSEVPRPPESSTARSPQDQSYAISTYRYLRLAIVAVVVTLAVSIGLERSAATCWNGSISAYYYTPVHSIFVAALGLIGVALFAIRGGKWIEEVLLNGAGFLAPVVAFVPTGWSSDYCPSTLTGTSKNTVGQLLKGNDVLAKFSTNNLIAFIVGGIIVIVLTATVAMLWGKEPRRFPPSELTWPVLGSAVVAVFGLIWREVWPGSFSTHAHSYAATLMFVLVFVVMLFTACRNSSAHYKLLYFACAGTMAVGAGVIFAAAALVTWHHEVLVLEIVEITAFVVFWFFQTIQLWNIGLNANGWQASEARD